MNDIGNKGRSFQIEIVVEGTPFCTRCQSKGLCVCISGTSSPPPTDHTRIDLEQIIRLRSKKYTPCSGDLLVPMTAVLAVKCNLRFQLHSVPDMSHSFLHLAI